MYRRARIEELVGKTLVRVSNQSDTQLIFVTDDGSEYMMYHSQDCCESVSIDDINGDLDDLVGTPILLAEEVSNNEFEEEFANSAQAAVCESYTWTFYRLGTVKGYVDIRWFGESNGYYSESVSFVQLDTTT